MNVIPANEPWINIVPADWPSSRIRNVAQLSPSYSSGPPTPDELCTVVPMELLSEFGVIDLHSVQPVEEVNAGLTLFEKGDVLFAKITPCMENGKGAFVENLPTRYAFGSTEFHVLRPNHTVDPKFLYYYTFNPIFRAYAAENMSGAAGQKRVSSRFLKDTRLFLPPLAEQQRIASYLDASCAAIDAAVAAKRRQLETLDDLRIIQRSVTRGISESVVLKKTGNAWMEQIPESDRPREKLLRKGAAALSDQELLAVLLGKGSPGMDVMKLAGKLAKVIDTKGLSVRADDLRAFAGVGDAKSTLILAALEFARRRIKPESAKIITPADLLPHVRHYADRKQEHFLCATINGANEVLNIRVVSIGLIDRSPVHPREVFADALSDRASAVIVAHNHPSGGVEPSPNDINITAQLKEAGEIVGIVLLDHIIFNKTGYFSFLENGRL